MAAEIMEISFARFMTIQFINHVHSFSCTTTYKRYIGILLVHLKASQDWINFHLLLRESWVRWTTKSPFTGGGGVKGEKGVKLPLKITFPRCRPRIKESFYENRPIYPLLKETVWWKWKRFRGISEEIDLIPRQTAAVRREKEMRGLWQNKIEKSCWK